MSLAHVIEYRGGVIRCTMMTAKIGVYKSLIPFRASASACLPPTNVPASSVSIWPIIEIWTNAVSTGRGLLNSGFCLAQFNELAAVPKFTTTAPSFTDVYTPAGDP